MRVVLYADDMEPITVLELGFLAHEYLQERGRVRLAVMLPINLSVDAETPITREFPTVTIFAEQFVRNGRKHMMLFTHDEESALLLKCAFLPGQRAGLQERERAAFAQGFLNAFARIGGAQK